METITIIQFALIVVIVCYLSINMLYLVKVDPVLGPLSESPFISVCVPARDEERNIEACLTSLLRQNYPNFEVIVVDDHSSDATPEIIGRLSRDYSNLIFLKSAPLPRDWFGKPFALHQAVRKARGNILIFTDADPIFEPNCLTTAIYTMQMRGLDVLTLIPGAILTGFWERTVQPMVFALIAALTRFRKINSPDYKNAMGIGAFLMFKRSVYETVGGHERVKQKIVEDIELAKCAKRAGFNLTIADGKSILSIRMYHSLNEIWNGWRKNIFTALKKSVFWTLYYMGIILAFQVTSYAIFFYHLFSGVLFWSTVSFLGAFLVAATGMKLCEELKIAPFHAAFFPLGAVVMSGIMINSMMQSLVKRRTEWRGRVYEDSETA